MALTPYWRFLTALLDFQGFTNADWNRLTSALDAQVPPFIEKMFGNGVYYGGLLQADKTVGTTRAFAYGTHIYMPDTDNAIAGLTAGIVNYVWLTMLQDPAHDDSPEENVGQFTATAGNRPDNSKSIFLGTMTLDLATGLVTAIDQVSAPPLDTTKDGEEDIFPAMMRVQRGVTNFRGLAVGATATFQIPDDATIAAHEGWYFRVPGAVIFENLPSGWEYLVVDNSHPEHFHVQMYNGGGYAADALAIEWKRWGWIRPAWTGIWGRESYPWPGSGHILKDE